MDDLSSGDTKERHRVYRRAQMQIDKILDPAASVPSVFIEPRKRCAGAPGTWWSGRVDTGVGWRWAYGRNPGHIQVTVCDWIEEVSVAVI